MNLLLPQEALSCNASTQLFSGTRPDPSALSAPVRSFYRWLKRWFDQTGDVSPSTRYLAKKQGVTERCIYKRLKILLDAGFIRLEVVAGVMRRIIPLVDLTERKPAPKMPRQPASKGVSIHTRVQGFVQGFSSGVQPYRVSTQETQDSSTTTVQTVSESVTEAPVVALLVKNGVGKHVARKLVQEVGEEIIREQVEALPHRRFQDKAAFLVSAIRNTFALPAALQEERERKVREVKKREQAAFARTLKEKQQNTQQQTLAAFEALPESDRKALLAQAEAKAFDALPRELAERTRLRGGVVWQASVRAALLKLLT